jgi:C4-dicarboxylate transporter DctM subunit
MSSITLTILLFLLMLGIPIAAGLVILSIITGHVFSPMPLWIASGEIAWSAATEFTLFAIPLYVLLGELLLRGGISERMYKAMAAWISWLPGGLMHANVGFATLFAAICGSSVASAATLGTVANPQLGTFKYNERLFLGTIAAGGTLGILIPPSIPMLIYGVMTETGIPKLYLAGFIPGVLLASLFSLAILVSCIFRPAWGGIRYPSNWQDRIALLPDLIPPLMFFLVVVGSIYLGWATASESAGLGVLMALILAAWKRNLSFKMLGEALTGTVRTTAMIVLIIVAAFILNFTVVSLGVSQEITEIVAQAKLSKIELIILIVVFYTILGMFMETLSMMVSTVPVIFPAVVAAGFDPIWFGVMMMLLLETSLLTPPVGINLFVVQSTRKSGPLIDVIYGSLPFTIMLFVMIGLIIAFPDIVLFLPRIFG